MASDNRLFVFMDLLLAMGIAWSISGGLRLASRQRRSSADTPYGIFVLVVFSLSMLDNLIRPELLWLVGGPAFFALSRNSYYLIGPALWVYTQSVLRPQYRLGWSSVFHAAPFLFWLVMSACLPGTLFPEPQMGLAAGGWFAAAGLPHPPWNVLRDISASLSRLGYSAALLLEIRRHFKRVPDVFSRYDSRNTLTWLFLLLCFYTALFSLSLVMDLFLPRGIPARDQFAAYVRYAPAIIFVFLFSQFSVDQRPLEDTRIRDENLKPGEGKYGKSGNTEAELAETYRRLLIHMERSKPYLDPELSLSALADQLGETRHRLSEAINRRRGENFYYFVNRFRLDEFKRAVETQRFPQYTIVAIAFECGFRSSSAFYSMFRKTFGQTPKDFAAGIPADSR